MLVNILYKQCVCSRFQSSIKFSIQRRGVVVLVITFENYICVWNINVALPQGILYRDKPDLFNLKPFQCLPLIPKAYASFQGLCSTNTKHLLLELLLVELYYHIKLCSAAI